MASKPVSFIRYGEESDKSFEEAKAAVNKRKDKQKRFWMKPGISRKIIFLDDGAPEIIEHVITPNGDFSQEWYDTCVGAALGCPHCKAKKPTRQIWVYSIIDTTKYTNREGKEIAYKRMLLCVPRGIQEILKTKKKEYGRLAGYCFTVSRSDDKSARCGNDFSIVLREGKLLAANLERLKTQYAAEIEPFDYRVEFLPSHMGAGSHSETMDDDDFNSDEETAAAAQPPAAQAGQSVSPAAKPKVEDDMPF